MYLTKIRLSWLGQLARRSDNDAKVRRRGSPTNTVADFEQSGLIAGHAKF
jgi:hypothetical protein